MARDERRLQYRVDVEEPLVEVRVVGSRGLAGWVVDISFDGAGILFEEDRAPRLQLADTISIQLSGPGFQSAVDLSATVIHTQRTQGFLRYGLKFRSPTQVDAQADRLVELFNRRWAVRVAAREPVEVSLVSGLDGTRSRGSLSDLSISGLGVRIPRGTKLQVNDRLAAAMQLPPSNEVVDIEGRVRWVAPGAIALGVEIEPERTRDLGRQRRRIVEYIRRCQQRES